MRRYGQIALLIALGMGILFVDFFTKGYVYSLLPIVDYSMAYPYGGWGIFHDYLGVDFSISLALNKGAAWGAFADFQLILLIVRILVIACLICYLLFFNKQRNVELPLVLIIAGALGNVIDFFLYGYVIDFFHFNLWGYHFPIFNVADAMITMGVIALFFIACFAKKKAPSSI